jgi:hypothetical protein
MGVEARSDDLGLAASQVCQPVGGVCVAGVKEARAPKALRLPLETVQHQPVIVTIGFRLDEHSPVYAFLCHARHIVRQRIVGPPRGIGHIGSARVKGIAIRVGAKHVGVPLDNHSLALP